MHRARPSPERGGSLVQRTSPTMFNTRKNAGVFLLLIAPNAILFVVFTYLPIIYSVYLSFTRWDFLSREKTFVGLRNYLALARDPAFWIVLKNSLLFTVFVVCIAQTLAFLLASLLNRKMRGLAIFRTAAFMPHITTTAAVTIVFVLLLDPDMGPLSYAYRFLGINGVSFLSTPGWSLVAITIVGIWKEIGFSTVFFLAGLQGIHKTYYEAAALDGASKGQALRYVTLPLMTPVILFLMISGFIETMKKFDIVALMTEGGPVYPDSATFVFHLYKLSFLDFKAGYASAFGIVFFIVIVAVSVFQHRVSGKWVHYGQH